MVKKKGKSKRTTLKDKYKIQRRIVDTHRKRKKEAKKDAKSGKVIAKKKKDPGIPNSWPFKQDLLQEIQRTRERQQEQQDQTKKQRQEQLQALREHQQQGGTARTVKELMERAQRDQETFALGQEAQDQTKAGKAQKQQQQSDNRNLGQNSRRAYWKELKKVVDSSDVLLQVLDARDPVGTRIASQVEDVILSYPNKRMVLILNKMDLIPKHVVKEWLVYLRKSHPTIAISTTKTERLNRGSSSDDNKKKKNEADMDDSASVMTKSSTTGDATSSSTTALGMDGLLQLLKNYARNDDGSNKKSKTAIVVGVIGYPNVGKSSIINSMKRCRAVGTSPTPGFTTCLQEVVLDRNVRLLDSPGIVFDDNSALLNNCINMDGIDPIPAVQALLQRASMNSLIMTYNIPAFYPHDNVDMFLSMVAKSQGKVGKGGIPDKGMAARAVLRDWNTGKIPYFTVPPKPAPGGSSSLTSDSIHKEVKIVSQMAKEFDLSEFDEKIFSKLQDSDEMDFVQLNTNKDNLGTSSEEAVMILRGEDDESEVEVDDDDVEMDEDDDDEEAEGDEDDDMK